MKTIISRLLVNSLLLVFVGNLQAQITSDYDASVDFSQYKTYSFLGWQDDTDQLLSEFDKKRLQDSFKSEFKARNLTLLEKGGDMEVSLFIFVQNKTDVTAYTNYNTGLGYGSPGWGMSSGTSTTTYREYDYQVGTLVLDCYDTKEKKLIFQGVSQKTIQTNPSKREKTIPKAVAKLMKKYPVAAVKK